MLVPVAGLTICCSVNVVIIVEEQLHCVRILIVITIVIIFSVWDENMFFEFCWLTQFVHTWNC